MKKDIKKDEEFLDEEEFIEDEPILDEDVEIDEDLIDDDVDEDEVDEKPAKKAKKISNKKPMKKGAKIAIISSSVVVAIVAIALVALLVVLPNFGIDLFAGSQSGTVKENIDFSKKLTGFSENPASVSSASKIESSLKYKAAKIEEFATSSKDVNLRAAQLIYASYENLAQVYQYSYFKNQIGTTDLNGKSGTLIVQRMRRQTQDFKDDTTLKLPYNHNFPATASAVVSGDGKTAIRYVKDGKIYRIISDKTKYNSKTGFLECDSWSKGEKYGNSENVSDSANVKETRINYLSLVEGMKPDKEKNADITKPKAIFDKTQTKIEDKGDYYEVTAVVDPEVANADKDTRSYFNEDNSTTGNSANIEKCKIVIQIWKYGLIKEYTIEETWSGKVGTSILSYQGQATAKAECKYSYTDEDCQDDSITEAIWKKI